MTFVILTALVAATSLALFAAARPEPRRIPIRVRDDRDPRVSRDPRRERPLD